MNIEQTYTIKSGENIFDAALNALGTLNDLSFLAELENQELDQVWGAVENDDTEKLQLPASTDPAAQAFVRESGISIATGNYLPYSGGV